MFLERSHLEIRRVSYHTSQSKTTRESPLIPISPQIPVLLANSPAPVGSKSLSSSVSCPLSLPFPPLPSSSSSSLSFLSSPLSPLFFLSLSPFPGHSPFSLHLHLISSFSPSYLLVILPLSLPPVSHSISLPTHIYIHSIPMVREVRN